MHASKVTQNNKSQNQQCRQSSSLLKKTQHLEADLTFCMVTNMLPHGVTETTQCELGGSVRGPLGPEIIRECVSCTQFPLLYVVLHYPSLASIWSAYELDAEPGLSEF